MAKLNALHFYCGAIRCALDKKTCKGMLLKVYGHPIILYMVV
jgi:hypothetical protein